MSLTTDNNRNQYLGNGVATSFAYGFTILVAGDLQVIFTSTLGLETPLVQDVDYSVAGAGDAGGGSVLYPISGSPLVAGEYITLLRDVDATQPTVLPNGGGWYPKVVEQALDRVTMLVQQLSELFGRALVFSPGSTTSGKTIPDPDGAGVMGINAAGDLIWYTLGVGTGDGLGDDLASNVAGKGTALVGREGKAESLSASLTAIEAKDTTQDGRLTAVELAKGRVSAADTTPGYLAGKLVAGSNIVFAIGSPAGNETLSIAAPFRGALGRNLSSQLMSKNYEDELHLSGVEYDTDTIADVDTEHLVVPAGVTKIRLKAGLTLVDILTAGTFAQLRFSKAAVGLSDYGYPTDRQIHDGVNVLHMSVASAVVEVVAGEEFGAMFEHDHTDSCAVTGIWFSMEIVA